MKYNREGVVQMAREKKKMLILAILGILRDGTDQDHRIRQAEIINRLKADYQLTATRKSVRKNLGDLQEAGYPVVFRKGWFYEHEFTPAELNYLSDCILSSSIPTEQRENVLRKLAKLGGSFYEPLHGSGTIRPTNPQFLYTTEILHDAIDEKCQVSFKYGNYDVDKELHARTDEEGKPKLYRVNPYRIVEANGRIYLICNVDKYDTLCHFRVDRILEAKKLKAPAKSRASLKDEGTDLESETYISEHPYMYSGKPETANIIVKRSHINDVLDWFGMGVNFKDVQEDEVTAVVTADPTSIDLWLRRYADVARRV